MKAVVTGAAGFIGARLVESLRADHHEVLGIDDLPLFTERTEHQRDPLLTPQKQSAIENTAPSVRAWKPDVVFHLGACSDTTVSDWDFVKRVNLEYSQALWNICTIEKIPFFYASSAATYGDGSHGYDDNEALLSVLEPLNLYGRSKHAFDLWVLEQEKIGLTPPTWGGFKFFNVYGFGEAHKGRMASVAYHAIQQILECSTVRLFASDRPGISDGDQQRDFVAVEDICEVLRWAHDTTLQRGIYNLGTGTATTFNQLVESVFQALKQPPRIEYFSMPHDLKAKYQYFTQANMTRLIQAGYSRPFLTIEEGVARYVRRLLSSSS